MYIYVYMELTKIRMDTMRSSWAFRKLFPVDSTFYQGSVDCKKKPKRVRQVFSTAKFIKLNIRLCENVSSFPACQFNT